MDRLTQEEFDRANLKCRDTYRPVLIARDGLPVLDQVDSLDGYREFLKPSIPIWRRCSLPSRKKLKSYNVKSWPGRKVRAGSAMTAPISTSCKANKPRSCVMNCWAFFMPTVIRCTF